MNPSECWPTAYKLITSGDTEQAVKLCEVEPCSCVLECQQYLGKAYYDQGNMEKALEWFSKAAEHEDGDALFGIGSVHFVRSDFHTALTYYERAGDRGCAKGFAWIGYIYHQGLGVPRNIEMAIDYYKKAAALGYLLADRALIHLEFQRGNLLRKILVLPKFIRILLKAGILAYRDINDKRIEDVPLGFVKQSAKQSGSEK